MFQGFKKDGDVCGNQPDCYCVTCDEEYHHLGIMSHRAAHRRRKEKCVIEYSDGRTLTHDFSKSN